MGLAIPPDRVNPGRTYQVSYVRGGQTTTVEGRFVGREVTRHGEDIVLAVESNRLYIPISTIQLIETVEPPPDRSDHQWRRSSESGD